MEDLIELATYHDEQFGLVVQFLDVENNTKFYALEEINGEKVMLVKPQTFMNLSGEAIRPIIDFYKEDVENVIVIFDDMDARDEI